MKLIEFLFILLLQIAFEVVVMWWALSVLLPVFGIQPLTLLQVAAAWVLLFAAKLFLEKRS